MILQKQDELDQAEIKKQNLEREERADKRDTEEQIKLQQRIDDCEKQWSV